MALQTIGGGDYFGPVEYTFSDDNGCSWSKPEYIDELGWKPEARYSNAFEGVCDTVVNYDPASQCMVFLGHSVYYRNNRFMDTMGHWDKADYAPELRRRGCYSALRPDGTWVKRQIIDPEEFKHNACFMCGCGQRIVRDNGEWLVAFYSQIDKDHPHLFVTVYKLHFTGETFELVEHGNILELHNNRGLLEPQLVDFQGRVILTMRAEDGCAYYSTSADGLNFDPIKPWRYDNGDLLETSSTQQHFLWDDKRLFLSYTRKNEVNSRVTLPRSALYSRSRSIDHDAGAQYRKNRFPAGRRSGTSGNSQIERQLYAHADQRQPMDHYRRPRVVHGTVHIGSQNSPCNALKKGF